MGLHWKALGFDSVKAMVDYMHEGVEAQIDVMLRYVFENKLDDELRDGRWKAFARGYNGPAYAKNAYDTKMEAAALRYGGQIAEPDGMLRMGAKGKRVREVKEAVVHRLLPRAFPKRADTLVWLDPAAQQVWVGAGSTKKADAVVTRLIELLGGGLKLSLLQTALSPASAMATWLADKEAPAGFSIDRECELKQPDSEKASVRYARHTLDIDEVGEHIRHGKLPTQLAMTWAGRVSFVLTEALTLKKIQLLDVVLEGAPQSGRDDNGFDADVAISTGELRLLMPELIAALGGLHERQAAALEAPAAAGSTAAPWDSVTA